MCHKISLVQLITNLKVTLYLSICHTVYKGVLILFIIMRYLIINTCVILMCELTNLERYLRVNLLGPDFRLIKKNLPGRGLSKFEKHWFNRSPIGIIKKKSSDVPSECCLPYVGPASIMTNVLIISETSPRIVRHVVDYRSQSFSYGDF
jgi:hypothetical protein